MTKEKWIRLTGAEETPDQLGEEDLAASVQLEKEDINELKGE